MNWMNGTTKRRNPFTSSDLNRPFSLSDLERRDLGDSESLGDELPLEVRTVNQQNFCASYFLYLIFFPFFPIVWSSADNKYCLDEQTVQKLTIIQMMHYNIVAFI